MQKTPLTPLERRRFEICKQTIKDGLQTCFDTGAALKEIRDRRYYREDFDTFEEFSAASYQIGRAQSYRLIDAIEVKESLPKSISKLITNESQARALADVPEAKRVELVLEINKSGETITAESIKAMSSKMSPIGDKDQPVKMGKFDFAASKNGSKKPEPVYDDTDTWTAIPEDALPFWARKQEVQDLLTSISRIKSTVEEAKNRNDPMFSKVSNAVIAELQKIYAHILEAKPYAVCTTCMGRFTVQPKGCSFCGDKGLISKYQWDVQSRKEVKEMRMKMAAKRAQ